MNDMAAAPLLAKSRISGRPLLSLEDHCRDTEEAAAAIFREGGRWSSSWARFFRLDEVGRARFLLNLRVAGLFHDIGKANEEFQALLVQPSQTAQTLRHEHVSALVLALPEVRAWLEANPAIDLEVVTAAVLSHHIKAAADGELRWGQARTTRDLRLYLGHPQIAAIFERVREVALLGPVPELPTRSWSMKPPWFEALESGRQRAKTLGRAIRTDDARRSLLLAVKAGVIVADTVASGLFRVGGDMQAWIEQVVHLPALSAEDISSKIIEPRVGQISANAGVPFEYHLFQELAAEQGRRALLLAGCGAGKTLAAWRWAATQASKEPIGRVIFLYPTRGTATEGFRDYVGWAPSAEAALLHGTARYELETMQENPPDSLKGRPLSDEHEARLYALEHWPRRFFSATVDQFLGFMEHSYTGLCLLPALADSVVIFDEVHSYDNKMFDSLLAFLQRFDVPVLCMTATLPPDRQAKLNERGGLVTFPTEEHRTQLQDLEQQECRPRYRVQPVDSAELAADRALAAYHDGQRVLWVVNTVGRCHEVADMVARALGNEPIVYHSRFRLCDRKLAHERTIAAFRPGAGPVIAVTTQVCEMSLDLDADMLITEVAPVTALVQRFGRSNRSPTRPWTDRADVLWYATDKALPYEKEELEASLEFLAELGAGEVSQRSLSEALERHAPQGPDPLLWSPFLNGGYYAVPGSLREDSDFTRLAVLDGDLDELLRLQRERAPFDGLLVPVPKRDATEPRPAALPRHLWVAASSNYSPTRGFGAPTED